MSNEDKNTGNHLFHVANGGEMKFYDLNPNLKSVNVSLAFTEWQVEERMKCSNDPIYFMENYVKIVHVDHGLIPFKMFDFQKELVKSYIDNRFTIGKLPRQVGKSTVTVAFILWTVLFGSAQNIAILANKGQTARDILGKLQLAYEHIPLWMQQGIKIWNKGLIELENGSKVLAAATGSSAARGGSYNLIFLDEFAFVPKNIADPFFTSVFPTISSGKSTKLIMISTPNGMNLFHNFWVNANKKGTKDWNGFHPIEAHWSVVPGRDEQWYQDQIKAIGEAKFNQEYGCDFLGSSHTLINAAKLRNMTWTNPFKQVGGLSVHEEPKEDHFYVISVDTARGQGLDSSAFVVIDCTAAPYKVVAKYKSNEIDSMMYPEVIYNVATKYNNAHCLIEINDVGKQVADILHGDLEYEYIFSTVNLGRAGQKLSGGFKKGAKLGVSTSGPLKRTGCSNFKTLVESDKLIIQDEHIIQELSVFVAKDDSYSAEEGYNDDLVMSLVLFGWLAAQPMFKELSDMDIRKKILEEKMQTQQESLVPFGIISNGKEKIVEIDDEGNVWEEAPDDLVAISRFFKEMHYAVGDEEFEDDDDDGYDGSSL